MKGAGGEQKGGGWEEEEGEGVRANRLWRPHKDWPRTEGENREVGGNWGWGRGDPLLTCPRDRPPPGSRSAGWRGTERPSRSLPPHSLHATGMALLLPLRAPLRPREAVPTFPPHISLVCSPTPPRGSHLVSPLPRGVSIPDASGAPPSPPRAAAPDCPNAILESLAPAESYVWTSRAAAPKPRGGEAGRSAGRSPGHPGPRRSPRGAGRAPSSRGAVAAGFPGIPGPGLGEAGDHRPRRGGELRPRVPHVHAPAPPPPGRLRARPAGEGEPGSTAPSTRASRAVTSPPRGWDARRAEVTSGLSARAMAAAAAAVAARAAA